MKFVYMLCVVVVGGLMLGACASDPEPAKKPAAMKSVVGPTLNPEAMGEGLKRAVRGGRLGVAPGQALQIRGTLVDGDTLQTKATMGLVMLRVEEVAGRALSKPEVVRWETAPGVVLMKPARVGERVSWRGYEVVKMAGSPPPKSGEPMVATAAPHAQSWFVVVAEAP